MKKKTIYCKTYNINFEDIKPPRIQLQPMNKSLSTFHQISFDNKNLKSNIKTKNNLYKSSNVLLKKNELNNMNIIKKNKTFYPTKSSKNSNNANLQEICVSPKILSNNNNNFIPNFEEKLKVIVNTTFHECIKNKNIKTIRYVSSRKRKKYRLQKKDLDILINKKENSTKYLSNKIPEQDFSIQFFQKLQKINQNNYINKNCSIPIPHHLSNFKSGLKNILNIQKINYMNTAPNKKIDESENTIQNFCSEENTKLSIKSFLNRNSRCKIINIHQKLKSEKILTDENKSHSSTPPKRIKNNKIYYIYKVYPPNCGWLIKKCLLHRLNWREINSIDIENNFDFKWRDVANESEFLNLSCEKKQMYNHFEFHNCLTNKYKMFLNFSKYCEKNKIEVFKYIPFTIIFDSSNIDDFSYYRMSFKKIFENINNYIFENESVQNQYFDRRKINYKTYFPINDQKFGNKLYCEIPSSHYSGKNLWIVKAPNLNMGRCINVFNNYNEIIKFIKEISKGNVRHYNNINEKNDENINDKKYQENIYKDFSYRSNIIVLQKYIEKPFLYNNRKFDIRVWVLLTHKMDCFMFKEGHLKASSLEYNLENNNSFIHLTNYSLQKYSKFFSKYEEGNEISFEKFQKYIDSKEDNFDFKKEIIPKFKEIIELTMKSSKFLINEKERQYCFEIFGYDFMMDEEKNVYLIEINTNPGLEISSDIIKMLVPRMIDDALRLTIDDLFSCEYDKKWKNEKGDYYSNFQVDGYSNEENLWDFICNINEDKICYGGQSRDNSFVKNLRLRKQKKSTDSK